MPRVMQTDRRAACSNHRSIGRWGGPQAGYRFPAPRSILEAGSKLPAPEAGSKLPAPQACLHTPRGW
jgi:hypothetical protein